VTGGAPAQVVVEDYDPAWPATFARLRERVVEAVGPLALAVEHIGSTAVPGLAAKPIVDLDVVIADQSDLPEVVRRLRPLGYRHEGDLGVLGREAFTTPAGLPAHHLYVRAAGSQPLVPHLAFRDVLRADAGTASAYADLKRSLAARLGHDRVAYTEGKSAFIERVLKAATPRPPAARR
jgi:GrpB-like predicted nucleotidyltransferase (UPF0157 family)